MQLALNSSLLSEQQNIYIAKKAFHKIEIISQIRKKDQNTWLFYLDIKVKRRNKILLLEEYQSFYSLKEDKLCFESKICNQENIEKPKDFDISLVPYLFKFDFLTIDTIQTKKNYPIDLKLEKPLALLDWKGYKAKFFYDQSNVLRSMQIKLPIIGIVEIKKDEN